MSGNVSDIGLYKEKLVLACGDKTKKADPQFRSNVKLGKELGLEVVTLVGTHAGYAGETMEAWVRDLVGVLKKRGRAGEGYACVIFVDSEKSYEIIYT